MRNLVRLLPILLITLIVHSCQSEEDQSLLIGTWKSSAVYQEFKADGNGSTWDVAEDVSKDEAQTFKWTLEGNELMIMHNQEMTRAIPKNYTITKLTATDLQYRDDLGKEYSFKKVN